MILPTCPRGDSEVLRGASGRKRNEGSPSLIFIVCAGCPPSSLRLPTKKTFCLRILDRNYGKFVPLRILLEGVSDSIEVAEN